MVTKTLKQLSYANVMATLAVFMVLGGGAYAATKLPKNSVTSLQVKDRSLLGKDFKSGQLPKGAKGDPGAKGDKGDAGAQGSQGIQGLQGVPGANGSNGTNGTNGTDGKDAATNLHYVTSSTGGVVSSSGATTASCPAGEKMITGGGGFVQAFTEGIDSALTHIISYSGPLNGSNA